MEVDDVKRAKTSKYKVTTEADVEDETESNAKMNNVEIARRESKTTDTNKEGLQGVFSESPTARKPQNDDETKDIQNLDSERSPKDSENEDKDKLTMSDGGTPKNDGSIFGIPESKKRNKTLKVTAGGSTIETPQRIKTM